MRASHSPVRRASSGPMNRQRWGAIRSAAAPSRLSAPVKHRWGSTVPGSVDSRYCSASWPAKARAP